jgi:hypothetical protein
LLGTAFELRFETGITTLRMPSGLGSLGSRFWSGEGSRCDPQRREQLKRDVIAFHERYRNELGIAMPRAYLVTIGSRR